MKIIATILFAVAATVPIAAPKIEVMPELVGQVNAQTANNAIPWYVPGNYDAMEMEPKQEAGGEGKPATQP